MFEKRALEKSLNKKNKVYQNHETIQSLFTYISTRRLKLVTEGGKRNVVF
jgi:hypothetical protein